jgi:hypothetical protein
MIAFLRIILLACIVYLQSCVLAVSSLNNLPMVKWWGSGVMSESRGSNNRSVIVGAMCYVDELYQVFVFLYLYLI